MHDTDDYKIPYQQASQHDGHDAISPLSPDAKPRPRETRGLTPLIRCWWREILSAVLSVTCLVATIVVLFKIDGILLSSWTVFASPNAVISILSTAAKAAIILPLAESISQLKWLHLNSKSRLEQLQIFDDASRGPSGALLFLMQARGASIASYLGCIVIVAALALDPFTQQILRYASSSTAIPHQNSSVSHFLVFDKGNYATQVTGTFNVVSDFRDQDVVAGGLSGLYGHMPSPPFSCPGANCTFPEVTSLGLCNTCSNVTLETRIDCHNNLTAAQVSSGIVNYCVYTVPSGASFNISVTYSLHSGLSNPTMEISVNRSSPTYTTLTEFAFVHSTQNLTSASFEGWQKTMTSYECSFDLCAWSFSNWSYEDGILTSGDTSQSTLNFTSGGDHHWWESYLDYEALDPQFPANQTYTMLNFDKNNIGVNLEDLLETDYFVNSIYQSNDDVPAGLRNLARGTTYNMMSGPNATQALGLVTQYQTYIHVQWPWLSLSVALVVATVILLAMTIRKTQKAHVHPWKSSLGPLIFADSSRTRTANNGGDDATRRADEYQSKRAMTIKEVLLI